MKWVVTAHRDWERLDIAQLEIESLTREEATQLAKQQLEAGQVPWIEGEQHLRDSGFIITSAG